MFWLSSENHFQVLKPVTIWTVHQMHSFTVSPQCAEQTEWVTVYHKYAQTDIVETYLLLAGIYWDNLTWGTLAKLYKNTLTSYSVIYVTWFHPGFTLHSTLFAHNMQHQNIMKEDKPYLVKHNSTHKAMFTANHNLMFGQKISSWSYLISENTQVNILGYRRLHKYGAGTRNRFWLVS